MHCLSLLFGVTLLRGELTSPCFWCLHVRSWNSHEFLSKPILRTKACRTQSTDMKLQCQTVAHDHMMYFLFAEIAQLFDADLIWARKWAHLLHIVPAIANVLNVNAHACLLLNMSYAHLCVIWLTGMAHMHIWKAFSTSFYPDTLRILIFV